MFLGFALVLGWQGDDLFRVEGVPLLLSLAASVYGLVCGVFLDSPRRWRWDQRQKPRPGTAVPRISPATKTFVAQVPRTLPKRPTTALERAELLPPAGTPGGASAGAPGGSAAIPYLDDDGGEPDDLPRDAEPVGGPGGGADAGPGSLDTPAGMSGASMPTERLDQAARSGSSPAADDDAARATDPGAIELPTALEPRAQRSPWAWAAPPEWTRDEEDEPGDRSSGRR